MPQKSITCPNCNRVNSAKNAVCSKCGFDLRVKMQPEKIKSPKNYYETLEVEPTATLEQIKSQHRFLIHAWHPDKFPEGELKRKAEDKVLEINEAYSVLSNSVKREKYNKSFDLTAKPSVQGASSQSVKETSFNQPKQLCENCGLPAQTTYVEFYENVGMIFMRQHRSVKGNFCKSCIDYYFWNLTGKTMLLGWWGLISFIISPFILLNNLIRFVFTLGMNKSPVSITPNPSPFWVFTTISGVLLGGFIFYSSFFSVLTIPVTTYSPTPTARAIESTHIPTKVKTPTPSFRVIFEEPSLDLLTGEMVILKSDVFYRGEPTGDLAYWVVTGDIAREVADTILSEWNYSFKADDGYVVNIATREVSKKLNEPYRCSLLEGGTAVSLYAYSGYITDMVCTK